jgi:hypothetical protein
MLGAIACASRVTTSRRRSCKSCCACHGVASICAWLLLLLLLLLLLGVGTSGLLLRTGRYEMACKRGRLAVDAQAPKATSNWSSRSVTLVEAALIASDTVSDSHLRSSVASVYVCMYQACNIRLVCFVGKIQYSNELDNLIQSDDALVNMIDLATTRTTINTTDWQRRAVGQVATFTIQAEPAMPGRGKFGRDELDTDDTSSTRGRLSVVSSTCSVAIEVASSM